VSEPPKASSEGRPPLAAVRRALRGSRLAVRAALDLLWPPVCVGCGAGMEPGAGDIFCGRCRTELPLFRGRCCPRCATPLGPFESDHGGRHCTDCGGLNLVFRRAVAVGVYDGPLGALVKAYKYTPRGRGEYLAAPLADMLVERLLSPDCPFDVKWADVVVPTPTHPSRVRERGFDHTAVLAKLVARRLGLPLESGNLVKTAATPAQAGLSRAERLENLKGALSVRRPERIKGRTVLMVDDVLTTCATAEECARALKLAGARETWVAAVARAIAGRDAEAAMGFTTE
jgi:ComF family protein